MRVLLKLSGEALMGDGKYGICNAYVKNLTEQIKDLTQSGIQVAIVVGGGNIFRWIGTGAQGMERNNADSIGMLATIINTMALHDSFLSIGVESRVYTAKAVESIGRTFTASAAMHDVNKGHVVILGGGTGNPFFTTDTASVLRALELKCDMVIKCTNVDYLYDKDPKKHFDAKKIQETTYQEVIEKGLRAMDLTAIALAWDQKLPILIMNIKNISDIKEYKNGKKIGTIVK